MLSSATGALEPRYVQVAGGGTGTRAGGASPIVIPDYAWILLCVVTACVVVAVSFASVLRSQGKAEPGEGYQVLAEVGLTAAFAPLQAVTTLLVFDHLDRANMLFVLLGLPTLLSAAFCFTVAKKTFSRLRGHWQPPVRPLFLGLTALLWPCYVALVGLSVLGTMPG